MTARLLPRIRSFVDWWIITDAYLAAHGHEQSEHEDAARRFREQQDPDVAAAEIAAERGNVA